MDAQNPRAAAQSGIMPCAGDKEYYIDDVGTVHTAPAYALSKRAFDIVFSLFFIFLLAVPMGIIALLVKCTSKGSVLYRQERLGLDGVPFHVIKFRSMRMDAERDGIRWSEGEDDPRITPLGRVLRRTRLDELPQLWCILKGEMSVVGPRPERPEYYERFEKYIHGFSQRLKVKPGLTGLAQVRGGYYLMPQEKILYDMEYIKTRTMWLDIKIVFETVKVVFNGEGAK